MLTNRRFGWRSNTPEKMRCHNARCDHHFTSIMNIASDAGKWLPKFGVAPPAWWFNVMSLASAAAQIGSYAAE